MSQSIDDKLAALAQFVSRLDLPTPTALVPDGEFRWLSIDAELEGDLADCRVLVVGANAVEDARAFATRDARYVMACALESDRGPSHNGNEQRIDVQPITWHELDPGGHGRFDLVLCNDLVHRVSEPLTLLTTLRAMTNDGGTLLISSLMIDDPERSEYLRFVPCRDGGAESWWFVPGRLAFRWLVQAAGFDVVAEFGEREGPRDLFPAVAGYLRATAS